MKILFAASRLPHAKVAGGHTIVHERIRRLRARGHEVGLVCFDADEPADAVEELRGLLSDLERVPRPRRHSMPARLVVSAVTSLPPYFVMFRAPAFARRLGDTAERGAYDVAIAEFSAMGQYLCHNPYLSAIRRVISCHFSAATSYRKLAHLRRYSARGLSQRLAFGGLLRYELDMYRSVDRVLALTGQERYALQEYAPDLRVTVISPGVDTARFQPAPKGAGPPVVLFTGHYESPENEDAAVWFGREAWPRVRRSHPDARFHVVGPGPTPAVQRLAEGDPTVTVAGGVPDLRGPLRQATIFVCPVRLGSGLRVKVLEAMASGVPVVTTTLGVDGIPASSGEHALIADTAEGLARQVELLLDDADLRVRLATQGRALMVERFAWDQHIKKLERTLDDVVCGR